MDRDLKELKVAGYIFMYPAKYKGKEYRKLLSITGRSVKYVNGVAAGLDVSTLLDNIIEIAKVIFCEIKSDTGSVSVEVIDELSIEDFEVVKDFLFKELADTILPSAEKKRELEK